ncbi:MAG: ImmA/IrrE family metallo-endopeptidase [Acidobacteria bacterium]|nr:ImmA/IrrE family metallo-endopeptidase [Acidobacteriota bacterium]
MSHRPPSEKARRYERQAQQIRAFAGVPAEQPLNPYWLARLVKIHVITLEELRGLSPEARQQLLVNDPDAWSGGTIGPLPNGWRLVILNPRHSDRRNVATLMEEVCHVFLEHTPSRINWAAGNGSIAFRDYNEDDEEAAYAVGAAALIPYKVLRQAVEQGLTAEQIAGRYGVSPDLVEYRIKVTGLWATYKNGSRQEL